MSGPGSPEVHIEWCWEPLSPDKVRWWSYRGAYDARELAKATEIPHRGSLLRFCAADSAALEAEYRARHNELERCWWEEEAALHSRAIAIASGGEAAAAGTAAAGANAAAGSAQPGVSSASEDDQDTSSWAYFMRGCQAGEEAGVLVRSGAFEVDLPCRQLRPCYWPASRHRVLRGTWYAEKAGEWVPLKESLAEQLEEGYRQAIWLPARGRLAAQPGGGYAARLELTTHVERGLYALFSSEEEAWLCQETGWGWLRRIGASSTAGQQRLRLRRGYEQPASKALLEKEADLRQEALDESCSAAPVSRLVLVVHGIGQKLEAANIAQDAGSFRSVLRQVAQDQSQQGVLDEGAAGRTEVLPVQWRKHLHIEADQLSRKLMPPGIPSLRQMLHSTVVEILLYMSPYHRAEIVSSLVTSLNATCQRFMARNPGFQGSISILAHSLGTLLCYDILCHQPASLPSSLPFPPPPQQQQPGSPARPMQVSPPASPGASPFRNEDQQQQQQQQQQEQLRQQQHGSAGQSPGSTGGIDGNGRGGSSGAPGREASNRAAVGDVGGEFGGGGEEGMLIDLSADSPAAARSAPAVPDSPSAALQQELSRLRDENQRLRLQLQLARSPDGGAGIGGGNSPPVWQLPCAAPRQWQTAGAAGEAAACDGNGSPPRLVFEVDQLIMLGSPLGCFLALRGVDPARGTALGTTASAPLMQLAPGQPVTADGLPAVRRVHNLYHPYDPVAHRLEPLALPSQEVQRAAFVPLFKGGKRIHLAVQEFSEDVGSAASRFGTTLLSSLAFAKLRSSSTLRQQAADEEGGAGGSTAASAEAALAAAAAEAEEAAAEEAAAARMAGAKSAPAMGSSGGASMEEGEVEDVLQFGAVGLPGSRAQLAPAGVGALSAEASGEAPLALSPSRRLLLQQQQQQQQRGTGVVARDGSSGGIARVADGAAVPGARTAQGRLDFVMQESSLENQYLAALSAHFGYWQNADVVLFVLRAVHDLDVLTGAAKQQQQEEQQEHQLHQPPQQPSAAGQAAAPPAAGEQRQLPAGGRRVEPMLPRQHLIALP